MIKITCDTRPAMESFKRLNLALVRLNAALVGASAALTTLADLDLQIPWHWSLRLRLEDASRRLFGWLAEEGAWP